MSLSNRLTQPKCFITICCSAIVAGYEAKAQQNSSDITLDLLPGRNSLVWSLDRLFLGQHLGQCNLSPRCMHHRPTNLVFLKVVYQHLEAALAETFGLLARHYWWVPIHSNDGRRSLNSSSLGNNVLVWRGKARDFDPKCYFTRWRPSG